MKRPKTCRVCGELFSPYSRSHRRQKVCSKESCRKARALELWRRWRENNPLIVGVSEEKKAAWRIKNPGYWREWRNKNPAAVERNREEQRRRNREKRSLIAKPMGSKWIHIKNTRRIESLGVIAKTKEMDACAQKVRECAPS